MESRQNEAASTEPESALSYQENRKRVGLFFETRDLRNLIKEFFAVQKTFHTKMHNMVMAFRDESGRLSDEQQKMLEKLLYPYGILIANPFEETPTGDIEKDVMHILSVINARNEHFAKILPAMLLATVNMQDFNAFLEAIKTNEVVKAALLQGIKSTSWLDLQGHVDMPRQNLMRYDLLLNAIRKELEKAGCLATEPVLVNIMDAISFIMPELKYINKHRKTLQYLGEIDALLDALAKIETLQGCVTEDDKRGQFVFPEKVRHVRVYIDESMLEIAKGKADIIEIFKALKTALELLQEGLAETLAKERESYYVQGYRYLVGISATVFGENTVFAKPELDPREKLPLQLKDMEMKIRTLEAARNAYQYLEARNPDVDVFGSSPKL